MASNFLSSVGKDDKDQGVRRPLKTPSEGLGLKLLE